MSVDEGRRGWPAPSYISIDPVSGDAHPRHILPNPARKIQTLEHWMQREVAIGISAFTNSETPLEPQPTLFSILNLWFATWASADEVEVPLPSPQCLNSLLITYWLARIPVSVSTCLKPAWTPSITKSKDKDRKYRKPTGRKCRNGIYDEGPCCPRIKLSDGIHNSHMTWGLWFAAWARSEDFVGTKWKGVLFETCNDEYAGSRLEISNDFWGIKSLLHGGVCTHSWYCQVTLPMHLSMLELLL